MVTLLAWMAAKLVSSKRPTRYASAASWRAKTADPWNLKSVLKSWAISLTSLWKGSFLIKKSVVDFLLVFCPEWKEGFSYKMKKWKSLFYICRKKNVARNDYRVAHARRVIIMPRDNLPENPWRALLRALISNWYDSTILPFIDLKIKLEQWFF